MAVPPPHNLTLMGNSSGIVELTQLVNDNLMHGMFGVFLLVTIFAITFMSFMASTGHAGKAYIGSSFIIFIISLFLWVLGFIPDLALMGALALAAFGVAFVKTRVSHEKTNNEYTTLYFDFVNSNIICSYP